jgi:CRP-like cAMP-binding protein
MATSLLFKPFETSEKIRIIERFMSRDFQQGEELIHEGRESDGLYLILRGCLQVFRQQKDGAPLLVGELREGEVFGEISCLHQEPASASVIAATPGIVLRLPRQAFSELILSHPQILEMVHRLGEHRRALTANALSRSGILI